MRTNIPFIQHRSQLMTSSAGPGTEIVLKWREFQGVVTEDPVTGSKLGTTTEKTETRTALFHVISPASSGVRIFNEVEIGDAIADFAGDVPLDGRDGLTFFVNGEQWMPKKLSDKLGQSWDVTVKGQRLFRSVLMTKAT